MGRDHRAVSVRNPRARRQNRSKKLESAAAELVKAKHAAEVEQIKREAADSRAEIGERLRGADERLTASDGKLAEADARARAAERRVAPRTITSAQRDLLVAALKSSPKGPIRVFAVLSDPESVSYGRQFYEVLKAAGWDVRFDQFHLNEIAYGLAVEVQDRETVPPYAINLHRQIAAVGIPVDIFINTNQKPAQVQLFVGHKPELK
jgi:hypothetical protein